jgi:uncharacterized protein YjhX (UPF0386 family)
MKMINSKKTLESNRHKFPFALSMAFLIYFTGNFLNARPIQKQKTQKEIKDTQLLKSFEGYYQFQNDKNTFLQIIAKGSNLILKQLWDGKEIVFVQKSELEFFNEQESFPLKFSKDQNGAITQVLAFDRDLWNKTEDYKPVIKKEIHLSPQRLKAFEGKYKFQFEKGEDSFLQITATDDHIVLKQLWDGKEIKFVPESDLEFFCKEQSFPLKFIKDKNENIIQMLAFNRDLWERIKV